MKNIIENPLAIPFREIAKSKDQHVVRHFAGKVGASQIPDALVFTDESMIQIRPETFAVFATQEEYRPQSIDLKHSMLLEFATHATIVLPPLNLWTPGQLIETLTLRAGHMTFGVTERLNASTAVIKACRQAYQLRNQ